ncbi:MAG: substrate-binding domain-containing protein [Kiritimatiellae bacterium]|nr:substrate-binding domain-containing protein [Kiritimatiellia bacterium]
METVLFFHTSRRHAWQMELGGAFRFARTRGWRIQVVEPTRARPHVKELISLWNPIGCIIECSAEKSDYFRPEDFAGIPAVFLGRDPCTLPKWASFINPSPKGPGEKAAMEFLKAGIRSFAFVASFGNHFWSRDREAEFRRILRLHGMDCAVFGRKESFRSEKARTKACADFLKSLPKPCGVMAENDYLAVYTLDIARRLEIPVPAKLAVIGVDNDPQLCENAQPALSSVYLDFEQAGYRTCEVLSMLVDSPESGPVCETYGAMGLMRRGSTPVGSGTPTRVSKMLAYIREHACGGIAAADVAAQTPGSRRLAEMDFLRATGRTIMDELNRVRFERVEALLRTPSQRLGAIANLCGWNTENALRAAFRKRYGMPMREWRARNRDGAQPG